jgi:hypothetical protein
MPSKPIFLTPFRLNTVRNILQFVCLLAWAVLSPAQAASSGPNPLSPSQAQALVSRALSTELRTAQDPNHPMRYLLHKSSPRLSTTKEIVETRDGGVALLLSINHQPLSAADEQKEQARLNALASDPSLQSHRKQNEDGDLGIILKLLRMLPNAFLYQYAGSAASPTGGATARAPAIVEKFTFRPNPKFDPPDYETQALTALSGEIWIDPAQARVVHLEGQLQQDTNYGWGILGRLHKGGWLVIEQADVGNRQWRIVHVQMQMSLRVLFKTRVFDSIQQMTGYTPVPVGMTYRQAIEMLRASPDLSTRGAR